MALSDSRSCEAQTLVIAHRGASGYLPEHTLEAKALAYGLGADYIEQDVVLTKDGQAIVLHDVQLDTVTDVARVFPDRARADDRFYALDFTLEEIKRLRVSERIDLQTGQPVFPRRFPAGASRFEVPTLAEEFELIQGLNKSTGKDVGVYVEVKAPAWHREQGYDISRMVLDVLGQYGYRQRDDRAFVQCFDRQETRRLRQELGCQLKLIQLLGEKDWKALPADGLRQIAEYADGIGPVHSLVVSGRDNRGQPIISHLVRDAHALHLDVHPYTLRADDLPDYCDDFESWVRLLCIEIGVDGVFTDFPDRVTQALARVRK